MKKHNHKAHDHTAHDHKEHDHDEHSHDHRDHHRHMIEDFKRRFIVTVILTVPVLLLSPMIQEWFNFEIAFTGDTAILFGLSSFIYVYGGWPFLKGLKEEISNQNPGMMTLIAMAISVAYIYSTMTVFGFPGDDFFWELATLIAIMLIGHFIEMKSVLSASKALDELAKLMPDEAHLIEGEDTKDVPVSELKKDDRILIKAGEKVPADGSIVKGSSSLNESMLTGEATPVDKAKGDEVIGGSINGDGSLEVLVKGGEDEAYLSKVITMVKEAQEAKSRSQDLANKAARILTYVALSVGFLTLFVWSLVSGDATFAIARMATVMVIACPHALGLATPLVTARSTAISAQNGLLIRNKTAFENAGTIDTIIFDKTGTLTEGKFGVDFIEVTDQSYSEDDVLRIAATIEKDSEHPIARGILSSAKSKEVKLGELSDFKTIKGKGIEGNVDGKKTEILSPKALQEKGIEIPDFDDSSKTTNVFVVHDGSLIGIIGLSDQVRKTSYEAIRALQKRGIECVMITGDNDAIAKHVSDELGLDAYFAQVLPEDKKAKVEAYQKEGKRVAMTGDGINDAPALAQAELGIAVGSGTDVAAETADIILVNSDPADVEAIVSFGAATHRKMIQNLIWATGYNVIAIPLAAGVLYGVGILISPAVGAIFMSLSTVIVAFNAKLLRLDR